MTTFLESIAVPLFVAVLSSSVVGAVLARSYIAVDRRRNGYAEAVTALIAWREYPYRIRRRTSDEPATLAELAKTGHVLQERLERAAVWVLTENPVVGGYYRTLVKETKASVGPQLHSAWRSVPVSDPEGMNLEFNGLSRPGAALDGDLDRLLGLISQRFGFRRMLPPKIN